MDKIFYFSKHELWYLISQKPPASVIGFQNPMIGLLANEIVDITEASIQSLTKKQFVSFNNDHLKINSCLDDLLSIIISPKHSLLFGYKENGSTQVKVLTFHFGIEQTVLLKQEGDDLYTINPIPSEQHIISMITNFLLNVFWSPDSAPIFLDESFMEILFNLISAGRIEDAKNQLMLVEGEQNTKVHLLETLQDNVTSLSLVGFYQRNEIEHGYVDGLSIIAGNRYLWLFELVDEKRKIVRASKVSLRELKNKIELKIPHMERL